MQDLNNFDNIIHKYNYKLEHELSKKLTIYANNFLQTNFNIELYAKIYFNNSLKQVKGRTIFESNKEGYNEIELSGELLNLSLLDPKKYDYLYDVLNHELRLLKEILKMVKKSLNYQKIEFKILQLLLQT